MCFTLFHFIHFFFCEDECDSFGLCALSALLWSFDNQSYQIEDSPVRYFKDMNSWSKFGIHPIINKNSVNFFIIHGIYFPFTERK